MKVHALIRVAACAVSLHAGLSLAASGASDAAPAAAPNAQPPYSTASDQIRFGNAALFRNLIPSATL
ncbi:MAG TPA: M48 family peptidase, partial [Caballeronia sp.]|nr:M48 family peptidase [Caballeronia sp.]